MLRMALHTGGATILFMGGVVLRALGGGEAFGAHLLSAAPLPEVVPGGSSLPPAVWLTGTAFLIGAFGWLGRIIWRVAAEREQFIRRLSDVEKRHSEIATLVGTIDRKLDQLSFQFASKGVIDRPPLGDWQ